MPPIVIPNRERMARNSLNVWTKPEPSSRTAIKMRLATSGHLRPYRSEIIPKMTYTTSGWGTQHAISILGRFSKGFTTHGSGRAEEKSEGDGGRLDKSVYG